MMLQPVWTRHNIIILLALILVFAAGLRFWNVTHDSDLSATVSTDSRGKFDDVKQLATTGDIPSEPDKRYELYNQPLFLIKSYAALWKAMSFVHLDTNDQRMRIGLTIYMIFFSLGTVILIFVLGKIVFDASYPALFASLLFASFPVNVLGTLYVKEDIPLMFWFTAALVTIATLVHTKQKRYYLWSGILIGLAISAKYPGLLLLPIFLLAHIFVVFDTSKAKRLHAFFAWQSIVALGLALIAFTIFNSQIITEWPDFLKGFLFQVRYAGLGHRDGTVIRGIDYWWTFYLRFAIAPGITLLATLFFLAGLILSVVKRNRLMILISCAVLLAYFQFENSPAKPFPFFARYLDMAYPLMALLATFAFVELWQIVQTRTVTRTFAVALGLALVLFPLGKSIVIAGGTHPDTRERAASWIEANLPHGARIAMGSRPYSPQHIDKDDFKVNYDDNIHTRSVQRLKDAKFGYVVVNSFQYDRYPYSVKSSPVSQAAVQGYAAFAQRLQLIQVFQPQFAFQTYGEHNPVIKIYKIP